MLIMKDNKIGPAHLKIASSPSYTRTDLRNVIKEFLSDMENHGHATVFGADSLTDWKFETFLQWLAKREREGRG